MNEKSKNQMLKKIYKKEILLFALRIINLILGQISIVLITRISSVETYSQYVLINSLIMTACLINQNGLSQVILREIPNFDHNKRKKTIDFIKSTLIRSATTSVIIICLMFSFKKEILNILLKNSQIENIDAKWILLCFFLWFFCLGFLNIITESFRALGKVEVSLAFGGIEGIGGYGKGSIVNIFFIIISIICFILSKKISIFELIWISAVLNLFLSSIAIIFLLRELKIKIWNHRININIFIAEVNKMKNFSRKYVGIMFYLLCSEILLLINSQSDLWLLNLFSGQLNIGFYSVSLRTIGIIITPVASICSIYISEISKCVSNKNNFGNFARINQKISILSIPSIILLAVIMIFSKQVLTSIYGSSYQDASLILSILTFRGLAVVTFPTLMASLLMVATKKEIFIMTTLGMVFSVFLEYFLLKYFDVNGLAAGSVIGYWIEYIFTYFLLKNKYSLNTMLSFRGTNIASTET
jgi:O-antigen/teichoic acid export membrane protein